MASPIRFYTDENVAKVVVRALRDRGVDVLTVHDAGMLGASDEAHLDRARADARVIFTQDHDFPWLHALGLEHAGIVYAPQGTPVGRIVQGLMLIHQLLTPGDMHGHVEFL